MNSVDFFGKIASMSGVAFATGFIMCFFALPFCCVRRLPRRLAYLMMFLVVFRLLCPVAPASQLSVHQLDLVQWIGERYTWSKLMDTYVNDPLIALEGSAVYAQAVENGAEPQTEFKFNYVRYEYDKEGNIIPARMTRDVYGKYIVEIWLVGVAIFSLYGLISFIVMKRRVSTATLVEGNVYETDRINTPFILGFLHPKIYLPLGLSELQRRYVLCHERQHIRHGDHIAKAVVYAAMCLHWFNFMLWFYFYRMFNEEIEIACDSDVLQSLGEAHKADYSETLMSLSGRKHFIGAIPCAFGENNTKERVQSALKYKAPTKWGYVLGVMLLLLAALVTCTNSI